MFQLITTLVQKQEKGLIDTTADFSHEQLAYSSLASTQQPPAGIWSLHELPVQTSHISIVLTQSTALTPSQLHRFSQPSGPLTGLSRSITRFWECLTLQKLLDVGGWWMLFPEGGKSLPFLSGYLLMGKRGRQALRCVEVNAALLRHRLHLLISPYITS